jgi:hypothetical protein
MQERFADKTTPRQLPNAADFHDYLEAQELLIGEAEVCAGPPAMIMEAFDAMVGGQGVAREAPAEDCARLEIAWEQHDRFTDHAAYLWNDLVMYVLQASQFTPELADSRLPPAMQDRLNDYLKQRGAELLAGQTGLVVAIARGAQGYFDPAAAVWPKELAGPLVPSPSQQPDTLAAAALAWLSEVAGADMQTYAPMVASTLQTQLARYDLYEATVLAGLNQHLNCLLDALGLGRSGCVLTTSALSHVCGRTLRDWADSSW